MLARRYVYCVLETPLPDSTRREALLVIAVDEHQNPQLIKNLALDRFYATEIRLVQELGDQGSSSLAEFPDCQCEECA